MEQHKVLLIIVAVAIVLAAVIGAGIWLFYPKGDEAARGLAQGQDQSSGFEWEPLDYLSGEGELPGLQPGQEEEPDEFEVTYGVVDEGTAPEDRGTATSPAAQTGSPSPSRLVVEDRTSGSSASSATTQTTSATPRTVEPSTTSAAAVSTATSGESSTTKAAPSTQASTATGSVARSTAEVTRPERSVPEQEVATHSYWVQVISSPNRDTIEQAQKTLDEHQLGSLIRTKEINGTTYYRLRLGPFAVRAEAEKFLGWVQEIDGFADSMIFVDYSAPVLAAAR